MVDDEWYPILNKWKWYFSGSYACRDIGNRKSKQVVFMHRYICMAPEMYQVDHINQNKLDNRTENLRIVRPEVNYYNRKMLKNNTSGFKGVSFDKNRNKYIASISAKNKQYNLGRFNTPEEAAIIYNNAAIKLHGEYACINENVYPIFKLIMEAEK